MSEKINMTDGYIEAQDRSRALREKLGVVIWSDADMERPITNNRYSGTYGETPDEFPAVFNPDEDDPYEEYDDPEKANNDFPLDPETDPYAQAVIPVSNSLVSGVE